MMGTLQNDIGCRDRSGSVRWADPEMAYTKAGGVRIKTPLPETT